MYLDYWKLKEPPFDNVPSGRRFYASPQHEEAVMRLSYAALNGKGVAMLTGEVGAGKTTVARAFMDGLPRDRFQSRMIANPAMAPTDLIREILLGLGDSAEGDSKSLLLERMRNILTDRLGRGIRTIVVMDEAHVIDCRATFEEIRMLLNLQAHDQFLMTLILLGQRPLLKKIDALKPLAERIAVKYHLRELDMDNTRRYIAFRLKMAGAERGIFANDAIAPIFQYARGLPLRINNVCDRSLLIGRIEKARLIGTRIIEAAIADIN